jgi:hypothetical protein
MIEFLNLPYLEVPYNQTNRQKQGYNHKNEKIDAEPPSILKK